MRWKMEKLAHLLESLESGGRPRGGASLDSDGVPSMGGEHIGSDGEPILDSMKFIPRSYYETMSQGKIKKGDILIVKDGATTGKTAFVGDSFPYDEAAVNEHVFIVRVNRNRLVPKYAFYWLFSPRGNRQILSDFRGSAQGGISRSFVNQVHIPLPPLEEQRRIVEILDEADRLRKLRRQADAIAERILPALFYKMFGDPVRNEKGWERMTLKEAGAIVRYGLGQPPKPSNKGVRLIRATNIDHGKIHEKELMLVDPTDVPRDRNAFLGAEEVLVVRSGAYTGDIAQVTEKYAGSVAGYDLVVTPGERLVAEFLESYLLTSFVQKHYFANLKARAGQPHLNSTQLENTPILVPKKETQETFAKTVRGLREQRAQRAASGTALDNLFASLLHRAFTGELTKRWREGG